MASPIIITMSFLLKAVKMTFCLCLYSAKALGLKMAGLVRFEVELHERFMLIPLLAGNHINLPET